jgi:hypothetical protein
MHCLKLVTPLGSQGHLGNIFVVRKVFQQDNKKDMYGVAMHYNLRAVMVDRCQV